MIKKIREKLNKKFLKASFEIAWKGKEKLNNIFLYWGGIAYVFCYLILRPIINYSFFKYSKFAVIDKIIDIPLSILIICYFIFHIILIYKNSPRAPKLTPEEKKALKEQEKKNFGKRVLRKFLLKESLTKWRPWLVFGALDLIIITTYTDSIF